MKNADTVLSAKQVFAEDLDSLWEVWDEKPKWISAKELYQEDAQDFWESWEEKPKIISGKDLLKDEQNEFWENIENDNSEEKTSSDEEEQEELLNEKAKEKTGYEKEQSEGNLISAKDFFKEDDSWWNDTVKDLEEPKVSAKEYYKDDTPWWETEEIGDDIESDDDETESQSESSTTEILQKYNAVPAREFFKEDECWWRDAVEEIKQPTVITAKEFFKDETPWWENKDETDTSSVNAVPAKEFFKEDQSWLESTEADDEESSIEECDEAYESIISDTSTMYSASDGASSDQYQECDWWLSPDNSETSGAVIKAKDLFKEEAWWDETSDASEGTDTKISENNADSGGMSNLTESKSLETDESDSENTTESDSEETHAESIIDEEIKHSNIDIGILDSPTIAEIKITNIKKENVIGGEMIASCTESDSGSEAEDIEIQEDSPIRNSNYKLSGNHHTVDSTNDIQSPTEVSKLIFENSSLSNEESRAVVHDFPLDDIFIGKTIGELPTIKNTEPHHANTSPMILPSVKVRIREPEANTSTDTLNNYSEETNKLPNTDIEISSEANNGKEALLIKSYELAINRMDDCLARLDARLAVVDSQLTSDNSNTGSKESLTDLEYINPAYSPPKSPSISNLLKEDAESTTKEKFQVYKVNVRIPESNSVISSVVQTLTENEEKTINDVENALYCDKHADVFDDLVSSLVNNEVVTSSNSSCINNKTNEVNTGNISQLITSDICEVQINPINTNSINSCSNEKQSPASNNEQNIDLNLEGSLNSEENYIIREKVKVREKINEEESSKHTNVETIITDEYSNASTEKVDLDNSFKDDSGNITKDSHKVYDIPNQENPTVECQSLCVSREQSIEKEMQYRESPTLRIDKNLWRCSTYEPITISQYDQMACLVSRSASFPGNLKESKSFKSEIIIGKESLIQDEPYNSKDIKESTKIKTDHTTSSTASISKTVQLEEGMDSINEDTKSKKEKGNNSSTSTASRSQNSKKQTTSGFTKESPIVLQMASKPITHSSGHTTLSQNESTTKLIYTTPSTLSSPVASSTSSVPLVKGPTSSTLNQVRKSDPGTSPWFLLFNISLFIIFAIFILVPFLRTLRDVLQILN